MAIAPTAFRSLRVVSMALLLASLAPGQTPPPRNVEGALHQMSDRADVIFTGQVVAVRRNDPEGTSSGFVEVEFRVDQAIRGCTAGVPYLLHEWAGLWTGSIQRYRVGQRLLMFLHAPGPSGLSSPINGMDGAVPIHGASSPLVATGSSVAQYPVADLRWIGTEVLRPVSYRAEAAPSNRASTFAPPFLTPPTTVEAAVPGASRASIPAQQTSVEAIVAMLQSWQKAQHAVR